MRTRPTVPATVLALTMLATAPVAAQPPGSGLDTLADRMLGHVNDLGLGDLWTSIEQSAAGTPGGRVPTRATSLPEQVLKLVADTVRATTAGGPVIDFENLGGRSAAGAQLETAIGRLSTLIGGPNGKPGVGTGEWSALSNASIDRMLAEIDRWEQDPGTPETMREFGRMVRGDIASLRGTALSDYFQPPQ